MYPKKYIATRLENNKDKSKKISGYLYTYDGELYLIPNIETIYNKSYIPNHMFMVEPTSIELFSRKELFNVNL